DSEEEVQPCDTPHLSLLDNLKNFTKFGRACFVQKLIEGALDRRQNHAALSHLVHSKTPVLLRARRDGIYRDVYLKACCRQVMRGLADADMRLDPTENHLLAPGTLYFGGEGRIGI